MMTKRLLVRTAHEQHATRERPRTTHGSKDDAQQSVVSEKRIAELDQQIARPPRIREGKNLQTGRNRVQCRSRVRNARISVTTTSDKIERQEGNSALSCAS